MSSSPEHDSGGLLILQHPEWRLLDWLVHGFSTRAGGQSTVYSSEGAGELNLGFTPADEPELVKLNRDLLLRALTQEADPEAKLKTLSQVHSNAVHGVGLLDEVPPGDGMVTATPGAYLAIQTADCVPVLLVDKKRHVVAAIHAGWRGTVKRIVEAGVNRMRSHFGSEARDINALIGPAIGPCCYLVGEDLRQNFASDFSYAGELFTNVSESGQKLRLDLAEANRRQLIAAGVNPEGIHRVGGCTSCDPESYFSHRKSQGFTGRMMSVVGIRRR